MHLLEEDGQRTMIFCKTKQAATNIGKYLARKHGEERVRIIHGNKGQNTRINAINDFREGTVDFLVARSEEHTSELQSLMRISYAVFCLKKKNNRSKHNE